MSSKNAAIAERYSCSNCFAVFRSGFARCPLCAGIVQGMGVGSDPLVGTTLFGKYRVEACIGEGGMGRVYSAYHEVFNRRHAIKMLFGEHAADPKMRKRLKSEARAVAKLDHRNVIGVHEWYESEDGPLYLIMEYVNGVDLATLIAAEAPFSAERCVQLTRQLCMGLAHAHDAGLVHRDFKSENVLITSDADGELAKIVDFGIAVMMEAAHDGHKLTSEGMVLGTPAFMAPEQSTGGQVDHRSDLFSLGVLLYEMLCGKLPFDGTPLEIARQNLAVDPPRMKQRVPHLHIDPALEDIAFGLMAKRPEDRYQSASDALRALDTAAASAAYFGADDDDNTEVTIRRAEPVPAHLVSGYEETTVDNGPEATEHVRALTDPGLQHAAHAAWTAQHPQQPKPRKMWPLLLAFVLVAAAGAVGAVVVMSGDGDGTTEQAANLAATGGTNDAAAAGVSVPVAKPSVDAGVAKAPVDAAPSKTTPPPDAAPKVEPAAKPPKPKKPRPRRPKPKPKRKPKPKPKPKQDTTVKPSPPAVISAPKFRAYWTRVARDLNALAKVNPSAARQLTSQFGRISLSAAMKNEATRGLSHRRLQSIAAKIRRAKKR